jgi:hypothetical protein
MQRRRPNVINGRTAPRAGLCGGGHDGRERRQFDFEAAHGNGHAASSTLPSAGGRKIDVSAYHLDERGSFAYDVPTARRT